MEKQVLLSLQNPEPTEADQSVSDLSEEQQVSLSGTVTQVNPVRKTGRFASLAAMTHGTGMVRLIPADLRCR
ncbi:MAG: hypothetical protein ABIK68_12905 [bacterium]